MNYTILASVLVIGVCVMDTIVLRTHVLREKNTWVILAIMLVLTAIFDSLIVGRVVTYTLASLSGIYIGIIPVEDFSYTFAAVIITLSIKKKYDHS